MKIIKLDCFRSKVCFGWNDHIESFVRTADGTLYEMKSFSDVFHNWWDLMFLIRNLVATIWGR